MPPFKQLLLVGTFSALVIGSAQAATGDDLSTQLAEARQEGSIWTALALNRHLSAFKIGVKVEHGDARLTGTVENQVDRDLAEQIALSIEGVDKVDNQLTVNADALPADADTPQTAAEPTLAQRLDDATLTATVKSRLLWNAASEALDIEVDSHNGVVTLKGHVQQAEAKDMAGNVAASTEGVKSLNNLITLSATPSTVDQAKAGADQAGAALSDAWVISKVKASLLTNRNLDGQNIKVSGKDGLITLSGVVASDAEKTEAVDVARAIRGVHGVDADLLKVAH